MTTPSISTKVARATVGEHHFCGYRVFGELEAWATTTDLLFLALAGRTPTLAERGTLNDVAVASTAGDPRVWPMKVARMASAFGDVFAGLGAGPMMFATARIGPNIAGLAATRLVETALRAQELGAEDDAIADCWLQRGGHLPGFGVPFRDVDARLLSLERRQKAVGRDVLPFWRLCDRVASTVLERRGLRPNIALGMAGALLDTGLADVAVTPMVAMLLQHLFLANAWEESQSPSPAMQRIDPSDVRYMGTAPRTTQDAALVKL